jgi:spermidine synthase
LLLTDEQYDLINIDPGPPITQPGMVNLHTREFFELAKARLAPGGVLYMRLSQTLDNEVFYRMLVRSISDVFSEVTLWTLAEGVDIIAADQPFETVTEHPDLISGDVFGELDDLFLMGREEVDRYVAGYPPITDDHPRLEYYLLARLRGAWPDGTPYLVNLRRNREYLLENRVPLRKHLLELFDD